MQTREEQSRLPLADRPKENPRTEKALNLACCATPDPAWVIDVDWVCHGQFNGVSPKFSPSTKGSQSQLQTCDYRPSKGGRQPQMDERT